MKKTQLAQTETSTVVRWPRLLIGAISMFFAGVIYAWSILKAPLQTAFGWSPSALALNFTFTLCFFCIGGVIASQLTRRTNVRITLLASAVLVFFGFFLSSRLAGLLKMLYFSYGFLAGTGIGMAYNAVISTTGAWFPDKKGTCSGVMMMAFGVSSLVLGKAAEFFFEFPNFGWRATYLLLGIVIAAVLALSAFLVKPPAPGTVFPTANVSKKSSDAETFETRDYTTREMIQRFTFWRFFLFCILTSAVGSTVISFARDLALTVGAEAALATTLVGVLSLCNGLGRILCGLLFDMLGRRKTMILANLITIVAPLVVLISVYNNSLGLTVIGLCLTGISYGCSPTLSSAFTSTFYGTKCFSSNYSLANTMLIPASFVSTLASVLLTVTGSYIAPFVMLLAFAVIALGLNLSIRKP